MYPKLLYTFPNNFWQRVENSDLFFLLYQTYYSHFDISVTYFSIIKSWILVRSSVSVEQCRSPDAMVLFTVMDHDVLTANDFAGEAFLGLSTIPGVTDTNASIDNFHGLKHTELPLMHQKNRSKNRFHPFHFYLLFCLRIERSEIKTL